MFFLEGMPLDLYYNRAFGTFSRPLKNFLRKPLLITLALRQNLANYFNYFVLQACKVFDV